MRVPDLVTRSRLAIAISITLSCGAALDAARAGEAGGPLSGYAVVHGFVISEGAGPVAPLAQAQDGNFYGTTLYGGGRGNGVVFRVSPKGAFDVLHEFKGSEGIKPATGLAMDKKGALYGLTTSGGKSGGSTAFKIKTDGTFTVLHEFGGKGDEGSGATYGRLALGADGNFYGAQSSGGAKGCGTVFMMTPAGDVTVLHTFKGGPSDGARPLGGLVRAADGNFYGTTQAGGANDVANQGGGTLYRVTPNGKFALLFSFAGGPDDQVGREPQAAPVLAGDGLLYGVTPQGGRGDFGTVYRIRPDGTKLELLHAFRGGVRAQPANSDGSTPLAQLVLAADGSLYGTSYEGGANDGPAGTGGGTVFKISAHGKYTRLHTFGDSSTDAALPVGALVQGKDGHLYGTTWAGGPETLHGTVYQIAP